MNAILLCLAISLISVEDVDNKYSMNSKSVRIACDYSEDLVLNAEKYRIDPFIMAAIAWNESRWTPSAFDGACCGIAQINPSFVPENCSQLCGIAQINPSFVPENCSQLKDPAVSLHRMAAILDGWRPHAPKGVDENIHIIACYAAGTVCTKSSKAVKHAKHILKLASIYRTSYVTFRMIVPFGVSDAESAAIF